MTTSGSVLLQTARGRVDNRIDRDCQTGRLKCVSDGALMIRSFPPSTGAHLMLPRRTLFFASLIVLYSAWIAAPIGRAQSQSPPPAPLALDHISWRHIGPASFGGRIDDVEAVVGNPSIIFVGTASG